MKNRIIAITFCLLIALAVLSLIIPPIFLRNTSDLQDAEELGMKFLEAEMTNEQGGVFYLLPGSYEVLSESTALLLWYAALREDRNLFESQVRVVRDYHLDEEMGLLYWKLRASMDPWISDEPQDYSNASIDDLMTIKALSLGYERWKDESYLSLAELLASSVLRWNIANSTLRSSASWASDYESVSISDTVVLSYADLSIARQIVGNDASWLEAIDSTTKLLLEGQTENGLFWYAYDVNQGKYLAQDEDSVVNSIIQMALAANHLAELGFKESATEFLEFFEREYESGSIYGNYALNTGIAAVDYESLAGYAWLGLLAEKLDREDFALEIIRDKLIPSQSLDKSSRFYGAFTQSQDEVYAYDQLVTLILLRTLINEDAGIIVDTSWITLYFLIFSASYVVFASVVSRFPKRMIPNGESTEHYFTILIPAKDEELVIETTLDSIFRADYPSDKLNVLVVNDGSTDNTSTILNAYMLKEPRLKVLNIPPDMGGKGKGVALNRGLRHILEAGMAMPAGAWIIGVFDADSIIEGRIFKKVSFQFLVPGIGGVQTLVRIKNAGKNLLAKMQDIEFLVFGNVIQRSRTNYRGAVLLAGNGQFTKMSALESARISGRDGQYWKPFALADDAELGIRILAKGYENVFIDTTCVYQEGIEKLDDFFGQRLRWAQGTLDVLLNSLHPSLWRSKLSWPARLDLIYTLIVSITMPFVVPAIWILNGGAILGTLSLQNVFPDAVLWANVFVLGPLIGLSSYGRTGYPLWKMPFYCLIAIIYALHWMLCLWISWALVILRKKQTWAKTSRVSTFRNLDYDSARR